jgi:uncharacterized membrane protein
MRAILVLHIFTGTVGLIAGYVALFSAKGAVVHRKVGMVFVYAMLVMCVGGLTIAVGRGVAPEINVPAALLTSYLIVTSLATVKPVFEGQRQARWLHVGAMLVALGVGTAMAAFAVEAFANGGKRDGMPAFPFVMFATFGLLGAGGDLRVLRSGAPKGASRLARHLWRMSIALFIAALSFSFQAVRMLRRMMEVPGFAIAVPMLVVLLTMFYWLWRLRVRKSLGGIVQLTAPRIAQPTLSRP